MEIVLNRQLFKEKPLPGCLSALCRGVGVAGAALAGGDGSGGGTRAAASSAARLGSAGGTGPPGSPHPGRGTAPPAPLAALNSAQQSCLGFIASIYYRKTGVCFLEQLSGQILADKQCWPVFLRQPEFITFQLIYLFGEALLVACSFLQAMFCKRLYFPFQS